MPSTEARFDVAVVGAGVAGLATAVGCAQLGLSVVLVGPPARLWQPTPDAPFDSRIYALSAGTVDLLARLKVWSQVDAARLQPVARMRVFGDAGDELSFDAYGARLERLATIAEESELLRVLTLGAGFVPGLTRITAGLQSMQVTDRQAQLTLDDHRRIDAALVVGADGAQSSVRAAAGISADVVPYPQTAVVANFACSASHEGIAWQWFGGASDGIVALLPLPGRAVSLVWSAPHQVAQELVALSPAALSERVAERSGKAVGHLSPLGAVAAFPLRRLTVDRLAVPRVALVGDAAHVVHPLAGQGLNLGLQDVSMLLGAMSARESWRDVGDLVLLRRYARARAEPIGLIRLTTDGLARLFAVEDVVVRQLRNRGMAWVNRIGPLKHALIRHAVDS